MEPPRRNVEQEESVSGACPKREHGMAHVIPHGSTACSECGQDFRGEVSHYLCLIKLGAVLLFTIGFCFFCFAYEYDCKDQLRATEQMSNMQANLYAIIRAARACR